MASAWYSRTQQVLMYSNDYGLLSKPRPPCTAGRSQKSEKGRFEKFGDGVQHSTGEGIQMLLLNAVGVLFPATPLAIVALNFRYTSLAGLMRELHAQLDKKFLKTTQKNLMQ